MATKRTPIRRGHRARIPEHMRAQAVRYLELCEAHMLAIRDGRPEHQTFYSDGRHEELVALSPIVSQALGIEPWMDSDAIVREALGLPA